MATFAQDLFAGKTFTHDLFISKLPPNNLSTKGFAEAVQALQLQLADKFPEGEERAAFLESIKADFDATGPVRVLVATEDSADFEVVRKLLSVYPGVELVERARLKLGDAHLFVLIDKNSLKATSLRIMSDRHPTSHAGGIWARLYTHQSPSKPGDHNGYHRAHNQLLDVVRRDPSFLSFYNIAESDLQQAMVQCAQTFDLPKPE